MELLQKTRGFSNKAQVRFLQWHRYALSKCERVREMSRLMIEGKHKLSGAMNIHGAKNSALPVLAAAILANGTSEIHNCPQLSDVAASVRILRHLG